MRKTEGALRARTIKEKIIFRENFLFYDILVCQDVCFEQCDLKGLRISGENVVFINCTFEGCDIQITNMHMRYTL